VLVVTHPRILAQPSDSRVTINSHQAEGYHLAKCPGNRTIRSTIYSNHNRVIHGQHSKMTHLATTTITCLARMELEHQDLGISQVEDQWIKGLVEGTGML